MTIVIIAGGSGTRLWPLSQPNYPKHLLRLTGDSSLLQNTYARAKTMTDDIYVVTEQSHSDEVAKQLGELDQDHIIAEPGRRGTASCIVLALSHIKKRSGTDETIVFLHADHHITNSVEFAKTVVAAAKASEQVRKITLIGLHPTYPATGFGYIEGGKKALSIGELEIQRAGSFKEKPDFETAKKYVESGKYYWNLGLFAAPISVFEDNMSRFAPQLSKGFAELYGAKDEDQLNKSYLAMENQPIDTALIEKTPELLVIPGRFDWADIGSFFDLHKILKEEGDENALKGEVYELDCSDSMIHASSKPIIAIGLEGIVVVDTPDGLVVCAKDQSQKIGDLVKKLQSRQS